MRLQEIFYTVRNNLGVYEGASIPLTAFFSSFKKGSGSFRKILVKYRCKHFNVRNSTSVITFFRLVDTPPPADEKFLKNMLGFWGSFFLSNKHREFSFKFYNNSLGLNTRLSHFVANNTRSCTFCVANNLANPLEESFLHLFFECRYTNNILCKVRDVFVPEITFRNRTEMILFWFCGIAPSENLNKCIFVLTFCSTAMFSIWEHKLKKKKTNLGIIQRGFTSPPRLNL